MTLIQTVGYGGVYSILTTDTRAVQIDSDIIDGEIQQIPETMKILPGEHKKGYFLSNYISIGIGGSRRISEYVDEELNKRIKQDDYLDRFDVVFKDIIQDMQENGSDLTKLYLNSTGGLTVHATGFYSNGDTGYVSISGGGKIKEERYSFEDKKMFTLQGTPTAKMKEISILADYLERLEGANAKKVLNTMCWVHSAISLIQKVEVSSDLYFHIIALIDGEIKRFTGEFDTSVMYDDIKPMLNDIKTSLGIEHVV